MYYTKECFKETGRFECIQNAVSVIICLRAVVVYESWTTGVPVRTYCSLISFYLKWML